MIASYGIQLTETEFKKDKRFGKIGTQIITNDGCTYEIVAIKKCLNFDLTIEGKYVYQIGLEKTNNTNKDLGEEDNGNK